MKEVLFLFFGIPISSFQDPISKQVTKVVKAF
jgi:hypothetical protein